MGAYTLDTMSKEEITSMLDDAVRLCNLCILYGYSVNTNIGIVHIWEWKSDLYHYIITVFRMPDQNGMPVFRLSGKDANNNCNSFLFDLGSLQNKQVCLLRYYGLDFFIAEVALKLVSNAALAYMKLENIL